MKHFLLTIHFIFLTFHPVMAMDEQWTFIKNHNQIVNFEEYSIKGEIFTFLSIPSKDQSFMILEKRITEHQYKAVTGLPLASPVKVNFHDAMIFAKKFTTQVRKEYPQAHFSIPTNRQWCLAASGDNANDSNAFGVQMSGSKSGEWTSTLSNSRQPTQLIIQRYFQTLPEKKSIWDRQGEALHKDHKAEFRLAGSFH